MVCVARILRRLINPGASAPLPGAFTMIRTIQNLIDQGLSAYHISQWLKCQGRKVYCFGSYYTTGKTDKSRICFYETDNGVRVEYVNR